MTIKPILKKGDTVMIISPSWFKGEERTYPMEAYLNGLGFEAETHPQCFSKWGQFAGTIEERVLAIHEAFEDPSIQGIFCAGGGYGALQLLAHLDYDLIKENPKVFVGYSDITALLNAFYAKSGLIGYHGPMGCFMTEKESALTADSMMRVLTGSVSEISLEGEVLNKGEATGLLLGGNMTVFDQLIGTPYMPKAENVVLFLEDTSSEKMNELDKKLLHLKHAGFLQNVCGIILGEMNKLSDNEEPFGRSIRQLIEHYFPNIPAITNVKCGHEDALLTFPYGAKFTLETGLKNRLIIT